MPDFQKRHHEAIAAVLREGWAQPDGRRMSAVTELLADLFERDNRLFDRHRFFRAVHSEPK